MPRSYAYGNSHSLVLLDAFGQVRDIYYPYVGLENHVAGNLVHRIGVFVEGQFSWVSDGSWTISRSLDLGWVGTIRFESKSLGIVFTTRDTLVHEKNIFIRNLTIENLDPRERVIKVFFNQQFELYHSERGDTAYFDPRDHVMIHYEGKRVFLIHAREGGIPFSEWTTGIFQLEGKEGTYKDAEDGTLQKNPIEHGTVDSTIGLVLTIPGGEKKEGDYWFTIGSSIEEAKDLHQHVLRSGAGTLMADAHDFWNAWVDRHHHRLYGLSEQVIDLFKKSQLYLHSHTDKHGAIIAAGDSDMLRTGRDTYAYVWPRDAAFSAVALDQIGDRHSARKFFEFAAKTMKPEGYFMHRNRADGSLGSSWHPWIVGGHMELPIQEDETALILWGLGEHYRMTKDLEFIESLYQSLILPAANFLLTYRDPFSGLPKPSYNLWEEKWGVHTFTAASVVAGLRAAAEFSGLLGKVRSEHSFRHAGDEVARSIVEHLFDIEHGVFYKTIEADEHGLKTVYDRTVDASSAYGIFLFEILPPGDDRLIEAMKHTAERLRVRTPVGGIARYEGDQYFRVSGDEPGNPWVITSLWMAQYAIARATSDAELDEAREWLAWCAQVALDTGVLPEQLNPLTKEHLSASPLTWSHAEYVRTVMMYLRRLEELHIIPAEHVFMHT